MKNYDFEKLKELIDITFITGYKDWWFEEITRCALFYRKMEKPDENKNFLDFSKGTIHDDWWYLGMLRWRYFMFADKYQNFDKGTSDPYIDLMTTCPDRAYTFFQKIKILMFGKNKYLFVNNEYKLFLYRDIYNTYYGNYITLFFFIIVSFLVVIFLYKLSRYLSFSLIEQGVEKNSTYECGFIPFSDSRLNFDIGFYLVSLFFVIFDLELVFLFPWSVVFFKINELGFYCMLLFFVILTIAFVLEWSSKSLDI